MTDTEDDKKKARRWTGEMKVVAGHWNTNIVKHKERGRAIYNTIKITAVSDANTMRETFAAMGIEDESTNFLENLPMDAEEVVFPKTFYFENHKATFLVSEHEIVTMEHARLDTFIASRISDTVYQLEFKLKGTADTEDDQASIESVVMEGADDASHMLRIGPPPQAEMEFEDDNVAQFPGNGDADPEDEAEGGDNAA